MPVSIQAVADVSSSAIPATSMAKILSPFIHAPEQEGLDGPAPAPRA
jgi:hypothetical protein